MAPKRGAASAGGASKKLKSSHPLAAKFDVIEKALLQESDSEMRNMFIGILPYNLGKPKSERHAFEAETVEMLGNTLSSIARDLESEVSSAQKQLDEIEEKEKQSVEEHATTEKRLEEKQEEANRRMGELAIVARAFRAARAQFKEAKEKEQLLDARVGLVTKKKLELETSVKECVAPLKEGTEPTSVRGLVDQLVQCLNDYSFDSALVNALRPVLLKAPGDRGEFELMCFKELQEEIAKQIADCTAKLESFKAEQEEVSAAAKSADESLNKATKEQINGADIFEAVEKEQEELEAAEQDALNNGAKLNKEHGAVKKGLEKAKAKSEAFNTGPLDVFKELEDFEMPQQEDLETPQGENVEMPQPKDSDDNLD